MGDQIQPPRFSILCATVVNRAELFAKLKAELDSQALENPVEIVVACDNKEISIGAKRQQLLERATGDYVAFIDDDDWVASDYVDRILIALESSPDCVGFLIKCTFNGGREKRAITSIRYHDWRDNHDGYDFTRSIYHKSVVRRDLALKVGFPDLRYAEDKAFSEGIMKLVKSEQFIDKQLYHYRYATEDFATKYGIKNLAAERRRRRNHKGINYAHVRRPFQH